MNPDRWRQVERLYHAAVELGPEERTAFLDEACSGDGTLRDEVASLLAFDDESSAFASPPVARAMAQALAAAEGTGTETPGGQALLDTPTAAPAPGDSLRTGQVILHFRIVRKLGAGGMGEVYLAEDLKLGRRVALKLLPVGANPDPQARERFRREARAASTLNHPNIVTVHDIEEAGGLDFIVMEYVEGETLSAALERGPLEPPRLLDAAVQVADAVAAAHAAGLIHRDLKPSNILVTPAGRAKVLDFGLARRAHRAPGGAESSEAGLGRLTGTGFVIGTVPYMSPEQTRGEPLDARSDVFSLGCVLYEAATGRRPFNGPSALAVMHEIAVADPPPPGAVRPGLPWGVDAIIRRALAKDPGQRFASAGELAEALRRAGDPSAEAAPPVPKPGRVWPPRLALAALALLLLGGTAWWVVHRQAKRDWARQNLPVVERLAREERYFEAFELAGRVREHLPDEADLAKVWPTIADELTVVTDPPGASVYLKRFARDESGRCPDRQLLGASPIEGRTVGRDEYLLTVEKDGYAPFRCTVSSSLGRVQNAIWEKETSHRVAAEVETPSGGTRVVLDAPAPIRVEVKLVEEAEATRRMTFVPGGPYRLVGWGKPTTREAVLDDFFVDRYEVSNREFKEFIDAGGYADRRFWKHPIMVAGKEVSWPEAVKRFTDRTGLPGPRDWSTQEPPAGKEEHPVTGVTWYEAAAYAEFRGKQLPTVFQWEKAARDGRFTHVWGVVMPWGLGGPHDRLEDRANALSRGTVPVESFEFGVGPYGCHHMAGNVSEWCLNQRTDGFAVSGGSWIDPVYVFAGYPELRGDHSSASLGFRCVRVVGGSGGDQGAMPLTERADDPRFEPCGEEEFKPMLSHYRYDKAPLAARVEEVVDAPQWRRERISFAGTNGDRASAYLYLPKNQKPPYQLIHYLCSSAVYFGLTVPQEADIVCGPFVKAGRAVLVVVLRGYRERPLPPDWVDPPSRTVGYRKMVVDDIVEERRGLDYAEARPDLDTKRLAVMCLSVGGGRLVHMAVEPRYRTAVIFSGGLFRQNLDNIPEANPVNFVPRIRPPGGVLMLNGRYDEAIGWKAEGEPLWKALPEPKTLELVDHGHFPPPEKWVPLFQRWFDEKLGPVGK